MNIFKTARELSAYLALRQREGLSVGFVPTMGALHEGHLSLLRKAKAECGLSVCSIFVNPTQFNNPDDFSNYPVTIDRDVEQLLGAGTDVLFLPSVREVYPDGHVKKQYDLGTLETVLEGAFRPGHFQGVCEVVERLLEVVHPDVLYLGQKDFQQCMVIRRLLELMGATDQIRLSIEPTMREESGLAMSSRNLRLSAEQRTKALALFRSLNRVREDFFTTDNRALEARATQELEQDGFAVDYVALCRPADLAPLSDKQRPAVVLVAASIGGIRLIDNMVIE
ncbi:pantoate--beta-alanine ligase [Flaviaesturariibacter amylovorans]|uniref:Pantothenate synthetase n=1 Tax=Flaviaesturariibacter amylovorans TaxID=1084520 RepID=A0ABP8GTF4_9BACT